MFGIEGPPLLKKLLRREFLGRSGAIDCPVLRVYRRAKVDAGGVRGDRRVGISQEGECLTLKMICGYAISSSVPISSTLENCR